ncbi:ciliary neurotrophic factor-like [Hippocampus zosterae]|uniref:ciliary neurotrophic factor-like n=1 Tax=Hippocampus zosterae TaxID=109293 RepID=UPI00223E6F93|nr:ciliary neurotrophic factor-like [Hippocampus zosterae]
MAEQQQQQQQEEQEEGMKSPDTPVPGSSPTGKALSLARLLQSECSRLLQLYTEQETFLSEEPPKGSRMVSLSPSAEQPDPEEAVRRLHAALRQCLGLLHSAIARAEEEWGELEGDYETLRHTVRIRLEHLLHTTKNLLQTDDATLEVTPDIRCDEETDGGGGGAFQLKIWTHRVLLELVHWADHATQALHVLHTQREGTQDV